MRSIAPTFLVISQSPIKDTPFIGVRESNDGDNVTKLKNHSGVVVRQKFELSAVK